MSAPPICTADLASCVAVNWRAIEQFVALDGFELKKNTLSSREVGGNLAIVANVTDEGEIYDSAENRSASYSGGR